MSASAQTTQIVLFILFAVFAVGISIAVNYYLNLRALDRGFGRGRDAGDWALRGTSGARLFSSLRPGGAGRDERGAGEHMVCPKCGVTRRLYEGHCTSCGTNVIDALIAEAGSGEQHEREVPRGSTSDFPGMD